MNSPTHATFTPHHNQRGAATIESAVMVILLLTMMLGVFQGLLAYRAKITLNHAVTEAVRTGAVQHAQSAPMIDSISEQLSPLYGGWGTGGATGLTEAIAKSKIDTANPVLNDGAGLQLHILSPTAEAFDAFGEPNENNVIEIQNHHLKHLPRDIDATAGVNIQDANLLKVHVTYGYKLTVPIIDKMIAKAGNIFDPSKSAYYSADPPRLPLQATAVARMHTAARKDDATLSLNDDLVTVTARIAPPGVVPPDDPEEPTNPVDPSDPADPTNPTDPTDPNNPSDPSNPTNPVEPTGPADPEPEPYQCESNWTDDRYNGWLTGNWNAAKDFLTGIIDGFKQQLGDIWELVKDVFTDWSALLDVLKQVWDDPRQFFDDLIQGFVEHLGNQALTLANCGPEDIGRVLGEEINPVIALQVLGRITQTTQNLQRYINRLDSVCASFPAGTPIWTPDGPVPIESITVNEFVTSRSDSTYATQPQRVTDTFGREAGGYVVVETEAGSISLTTEHPVWVQGEGWIPAESIYPGHMLATVDGDVAVYDTKLINDNTKVFNFSVESTPNYFAGGMRLWVHNAQLCNPWSVNPYGNRRLPVDSRNGGKGTWAGTRGNSDFQPEPGTPLHVATGGRPIKYRDGYPQFEEFAYPGPNGPANIPVEGLTGRGSSDFTRSDRAYREAIGDPDWRRPQGYSWHHHENCLTMILIPTAINNNAAHTGGAANLRNGSC